MKKHTFSLPSSCGSFLSFLSSRWHYLFSVWSSLIFNFFRFFHLGNIRFFISQKLFDAPSIQWALTTQCTRTIFAITACDSTFNNSIRMRKYMFLSQFCFSIEKKCDVFFVPVKFLPHVTVLYQKRCCLFNALPTDFIFSLVFFTLSSISLSSLSFRISDLSLFFISISSKLFNVTDSDEILYVRNSLEKIYCDSSLYLSMCVWGLYCAMSIVKCISKAKVPRQTFVNDTHTQTRTTERRLWLGNEDNIMNWSATHNRNGLNRKEV